MLQGHFLRLDALLVWSMGVLGTPDAFCVALDLLSIVWGVCRPFREYQRRFLTVLVDYSIE